ncbi:MAG: hypothetical protein WC381_04560 [Kiritimatiellia bacterium]
MLVAAFTATGNTLDFFTIRSVKFVSKPPRQGFALYQEVAKPDKTKAQVFLPFLEVVVQTKERTRADTLYARAYYYDKTRKLIEKTDKPSPGGRRAKQPYSMPVFFNKSKAETLYFAVPTNVLATQDWQVVVVFGDKQAAAADVYPHSLAALFDFPERLQVDKPERVEREAVIDPVVEYVVKTHNEKQPQITLFVRPPVGMTDISEADGVLAMCLLAGNVGEIKRRLQELESKDDVGSILRFANQHKLVILCWGSRSLWNPRASWDEQSKQINKQMNETFDDVAKAWAKGVEELSRKYGMPDKNFLLWGISGSAQYAARLALRQPQFFLAIHIHVPSSFDQPTPKANQVLWCLTTGECESGYQRSLRFVSACRELGYPIIYKAIPGLGHAGHPLTEKLGLDFFEYALSVREEKSQFEAEMSNPTSNIKREWLKQPNRPWPESFRNPAFVGDVVNQDIFRFERADMVPASFRIMLPTRELADTWNREE